MIRVQRLPVTIAALAALLSLTPLLVAAVPGFVDMPSHMARHHIMGLADSADPLLRYYSVTWRWIANLGVDLPSVLLSRWLGADLATRTVAALIAPLTIAGIACLSRAVHGRVTGPALIALPFAFHHAWMWGFLNYCLSAALALLVAAWMIARPKRGVGAQALLALAALAVWTAHMAGWAALLVIAAGSDLSQLKHPRDILPAIRRNLPLLLPVVPLLAWRTEAAGPQVKFAYVDFLHTKVTAFASALRGTDKLLDLALLGAVMAAAALALLWAGGRRLDSRLLLAGLLLALCAVLVPTTILNAWGTDLRLAPIAMVLLILAIGPPADPRRERLLCLIGAMLFLIRLGSIDRQWWRHGQEMEARLALLDDVPVGGKLGYLHVPADCGSGWRLEPDNKLASYAVIRRQAYVNTLFMVDNARLVDTRDPVMRERFSEGSQILPRLCPQDTVDRTALAARLADFRAHRFDAVWIAGAWPEDLPAASGFTPSRRVGSDILLIAQEP